MILYSVQLDMLRSKDTLYFLFRHPIKSIGAFFGRYPSDIPLKRILKGLPRNSFIIEAGAGFGEHTKIFAESFPLGKIVALEPIPGVYEIAKNRVKGFSNVDLRQECLTSHGDSQVEFLTDLQNPHESSSILEVVDDFNKLYQNVRFPDRVIVQGATLDELFLEYRRRIDLLWLDLQGMELEILENGGKIALQNSSYVHLEVSVRQLYRNGANRARIIEFMSINGFEIIDARSGVAYGNILWKNSKTSKTNQEPFF